MATNLDVRFEDALAKSTSLPGVPDRSDPRHWRTRTRCRAGWPRCGPRRGSPTRQSKQAAVTPVAAHVGVAIPGVKTPSLPELGPAPDVHRQPGLVQHPGGQAADAGGTARARSCSSTSGPTPASTASARCRSSRACTPPITATAWTIVGVETPGVHLRAGGGQRRRRRSSPTGSHIRSSRTTSYGTWNAYQNEYWPAEYLIDAQGQVRHTQFGEGDYKQDEAAVRELLYEAGAAHLPPPMTAHAIVPSQAAGNARDLPELRAQPRGSPRPLKSGTHFYPGVLNAGAQRVRAARDVDGE